MTGYVSRSSPSSIVCVLRRGSDISGAMVSVSGSVRFFRCKGERRLSSVVYLLIRAMGFSTIVPYFRGSIRSTGCYTGGLYIPHVNSVNTRVFEGGLRLEGFYGGCSVPRPSCVFTSDEMSMGGFCTGHRRSSMIVGPEALSTDRNIMHVGRTSRVSRG